ncbi:unnamed protein product [Effrenium voratum]|nr:unnamed protein product [Effrenium voratum]
MLLERLDEMVGGPKLDGWHGQFGGRRRTGGGFGHRRAWADAMVVVADRTDLPRSPHPKKSVTEGAVCRRVQLQSGRSPTVGVAVWEHPDGSLDVVDQQGRFLPQVPSSQILAPARRARHAHGRAVPLELSVLGLSGARGEESGYEWQFAGDQGWCRFDAAASRQLEAAQQRGEEMSAVETKPGVGVSPFFPWDLPTRHQAKRAESIDAFFGAVPSESDCSLKPSKSDCSPKPMMSQADWESKEYPQLTIAPAIDGESFFLAAPHLGAPAGLGSRANSFIVRTKENSTFRPLTAGGVRQSILVLVQTSLGGGILTMGYMMKLAGLANGLLFLLLAAFVAAASMEVLMKSAVMLHRYTLGSLLGYVFGKKSGVLLDMMLFIYGNGTLILYFVFLGDFIPNIFQAVMGGADSPPAEQEKLRTYCVVAAMCTVMPVSLFRDLSMLRVLSPVMVIGIVYTELVVLIKCFTSERSPCGDS